MVLRPGFDQDRLLEAEEQGLVQQFIPMRATLSRNGRKTTTRVGRIRRIRPLKDARLPDTGGLCRQTHRNRPSRCACDGSACRPVAHPARRGHTHAETLIPDGGYFSGRSRSHRQSADFVGRCHARGFISATRDVRMLAEMVLLRYRPNSFRNLVAEVEMWTALQAKEDERRSI